MSELKVHRFITTDELFPEANAGALYYGKSEADKVIADLKNKLAVAQQTLRLNQPEALYSDLETMGRLSHEIMELKKACKDKDDWCLHTLKELRHQKYKRCLAMVKYCEYRFMNLEKMIDTEYRTKKMRFSHRWWVKWLKLADKFKEAK